MLGSGPLRTAARSARRGLGSAVQRLWETLFRRLSLESTRPVRSWSTRGADRVLVVAPHPDDETAGCAGALVRHVRAGDRVDVGCVTDGTGSAAVRGEAHERRAHRRREMEVALDILGVKGLHWIGLVEGRWALDNGVVAMRELIESTEPTVVYSPSSVDFHPEHRKVAHCLAEALGESGTSVTVRVYPVLVPLCPVLANLELDVNPAVENILQAMHAHTSQRGTLAPTMRRRRYSAAFGRHSGVWEDFWELDARVYSTLHHKPFELGKFRGLRFDPWLDPLAFAIGMGARRSLRDQARALHE
jgi:LmbE family N-acetylglucosaminyl deacetylase